MPLESGSYLSNLVITNPTSGDPKSQGDDHLRLLKSTLKVTFSGFQGAIIVTGTDTGTGAAYVVNPSTAVPGLLYGMRVVFTAVNANTGAATLAVSGLTAAPIIHANGQALVAGDLLAGRVVEVVYDGASFQIMGGSGYISKTGNQALNGALTLNGGGLTSTGVATFTGIGASSFGGAVTFGGGVTATGALVLIGTTGNVTAPGTGTNDFSAGTTRVKTLPFGTADSTEAVSVAMLNAASFAAALPGQAGQSGKYLKTNGAIATWELVPKPTVVRSARTSNTQLVFADSSLLVDFTSGTFTQTFAASSVLTSGWFTYVRNSGTGIITLDPDLAETIDGLATLALYPGHTRLIQCDGSNLRTVLLAGDEWFVALDQRTNGTSGGNSVAGAQTRVINTIVSNTINGASLATNNITLPAGTYSVYGSCPMLASGAHQARFFNVTGSTVAIVGTNERADTSTTQTRSVINGTVSVASTTVFRVEHYAVTGPTTNGLGSPLSVGLAETYSEITIRKLA